MGLSFTKRTFEGLRLELDRKLGELTIGIMSRMIKGESQRDPTVQSRITEESPFQSQSQTKMTVTGVQSPPLFI